MSRIRIPKPVQKALAGSDGSEYEAPIYELADVVSDVVDDNKLPFFPGYTDHGRRHLEAVLRTSVALVPRKLWKSMAPEDAAVIIGAVLLHDFGMHLREPNFVALVGSETEFHALPWYRDFQPGRPGDVPWPRLWASFQHEARHFTAQQLQNVLGSEHNAVPAVAFASADELDPGVWVDADRVLIGEFLRRHHARLAHEVAVYGLPGASAGVFPVLSNRLPDLYDAIGVTARSHGEPLRTAASYLEHTASGVPTPFGAAVLYWMGVLRIADYLQLDQKRAPPILRELRQLASPTAVREWGKHGAVARVIWKHRDPAALFVEVVPEHTAATHFALRDLLADLQQEMDTTGAVLSETFGSSDERPQFRLSRQRVRTNLDEPALLERLPFLPRRAGLSASDDLFQRVVRPLYGHRPVIGGRELLQNAVDAVRERWRLEGRPAGGHEVPDISVEIKRLAATESSPEQHVLRIVDRGVGMTAQVVSDYFLRAGASFGPTASDYESLDGRQAASVLKAGHFGIGALAAFLLGSAMTVTTRHVSQDEGLAFTVGQDSQPVELRRVEAPVGTEIRVVLDIPRRECGSLIAGLAQFYALAAPTVHFGTRIARQPKRLMAPDPLDGTSPAWRMFEAVDFDVVHWRVPGAYGDEREPLPGALAHNGIWIRGNDERPGPVWQWNEQWRRQAVRTPAVSVFDARHRLEIALDRASLQRNVLPFEEELLTSVCDDVVAHAFVGAPSQHPLGVGEFLEPVITRRGWFPFIRPLAAAQCPLLGIVWGGDDAIVTDLLEVVDGVMRLGSSAMVTAGDARRAGDLAVPWGVGWTTTFAVTRRDNAYDTNWVRITRGKREKFQGEQTVLVHRDVRPVSGTRRDRAGVSDRAAELADAVVPLLLRRGRDAEVSLVGDWANGPTVGTEHDFAETWLSAVGGVMPLDGGERSELRARRPVRGDIAAWEVLKASQPHG